MPAFKPAYLIHGDDHVRIGERRARLRALAEAEAGVGGAEVFEGETATPDVVAGALSAMTFATGRRFLIVDGVERWKDKEVEAQLAPLLASMPPDTTVAFFGREEGRAKVPASLVAGVKKAGGDIATEAAVKPWDLWKWVVGEARRLELDLDPSAARALIAQVGERQPRLARELEVLRLELGAGTQLSAELIEERSADSAERKVFALADRLVGRDGPGATRAFLELRAQGERVPGMGYWMGRRLREALEIATRLDAGEAPGDIKRTLRMPPKAADQLIADARRTDTAALRRAVGALADLEVDTRGGSELDEDTVALRTIAAIAAG